MKDSDIAKADPEFLQMMEDLEKQLQAHPVVLSQNCCSQCFYQCLGAGAEGRTRTVTKIAGRG
jgi:predicted RND superfamily exporter protein